MTLTWAGIKIKPARCPTASMALPFGRHPDQTSTVPDAFDDAGPRQASLALRTSMMLALCESAWP
jgi:hypothetical protein